MSMRHLYNCLVEVLQLSGGLVYGTPTLTWDVIGDTPDPVLGVTGQMMCRISLGVVRPGKDAPMPIVAGRAPDRVGVMYFDPSDAVKAGQRIHILDGPFLGTFEIRAMPDVAVMGATAHHMEVQVIEVAQAASGAFPGATVES